MDFSAEKIQTMKNGARLITFCAPHLNTVSLSVLLPFEPYETPGAEHLIEHLFFERAGERRAEQINAEMTSRGSEIMGFTSSQAMCFSFTCRKEVFVDQLSLLYAMLSQREYGQEEMDKVLPVIRNEIFEYEFYDVRSCEILRELWFDKRYCESVLGNAKELEKLRRSEIDAVRKKLFNEEMCLFLAGSFSELQLRAVEETFGRMPLCRLERSPAREGKRETKPINRWGRGRELQALVTYHVERASKELKMAAHWLRSGLFDGLDAAFFKFFDENGFQFYSVDGNYTIRGDELVFSYLAHIQRAKRKDFKNLIGRFEDAAAETDFLSLVRPYLYDNLPLLADNPERLCSHYIDTWSDFSAPVTLSEEADFCKNFTNESLAACWRELTSSLRRVFLIGR